MWAFQGKGLVEAGRPVWVLLVRCGQGDRQKGWREEKTKEDKEMGGPFELKCSIQRLLRPCGEEQRQLI